MPPPQKKKLYMLLGILWLQLQLSKIFTTKQSNVLEKYIPSLSIELE